MKKLGLLFAVCLVIYCSLGQSVFGESGHETPHAAFAAYRKSINDRDWQLFCDSIAPVVRSSFIDAALNEVCAHACKRNADPVAKWTLTSHQVDLEQAKLIAIGTLVEGEAESKAAAEARAAIIKSLGGNADSLLISCMELRSKELHAKLKPHAGTDESVLNIAEVDGELCVGVMVTPSPNGELRKVFQFEKVDGRWYVRRFLPEHNRGW